MKKFIILAIVIIIGCLDSFGQEGLNVAQFLDADYSRQKGVTQVSMTGKQLEWSGLKKYKSLSVTDNSSLADKINRAVTKDGAKAASKKVSYKDGQLYVGFYSLGGKGEHRRYLFYLNRRPVGEEKITFIFLEGNMDSNSIMELINK